LNDEESIIPDFIVLVVAGVRHDRSVQDFASRDTLTEFILFCSFVNLNFETEKENERIYCHDSDNATLGIYHCGTSSLNEFVSTERRV
jgi:hypothetical protein